MLYEENTKGPLPPLCSLAARGADLPIETNKTPKRPGIKRGQMIKCEETGLQLKFYHQLEENNLYSLKTENLSGKKNRLVLLRNPDRSSFHFLILI